MGAWPAAHCLPFIGRWDKRSVRDREPNGPPLPRPFIFPSIAWKQGLARQRACSRPSSGCSPVYATAAVAVIACCRIWSLTCVAIFSSDARTLLPLLLLPLLLLLDDFVGGAVIDRARAPPLSWPPVRDDEARAHCLYLSPPPNFLSFSFFDLSNCLSVPQPLVESGDQLAETSSTKRYYY